MFLCSDTCKILTSTHVPQESPAGKFTFFDDFSCTAITLSFHLWTQAQAGVVQVTDLQGHMKKLTKVLVGLVWLSGQEFHYFCLLFAIFVLPPSLLFQDLYPPFIHVQLLMLWVLTRLRFTWSTTNSLNSEEKNPIIHMRIIACMCKRNIDSSLPHSAGLKSFCIKLGTRVL